MRENLNNSLEINQQVREINSDCSESQADEQIIEGLAREFQCKTCFGRNKSDAIRMQRIPFYPSNITSTRVKRLLDTDGWSYLENQMTARRYQCHCL
jgi:hypothetical protein